MKKICVFLFCLLSFNCVIADDPNGFITFYGTCDSSAAAALDANTFIVADDENNILRIYKIGLPQPVFSCNLTRFLGIVPKYPEADIEGATKIGNRIYWITSHGRNKDGKIRLSRYRFFATDIKTQNGRFHIEPAGRPYLTLVDDLLEEQSIVKDDLVRAAGFSANKLKAKQLKKLAPKENGLNIEALCADPNGQIIYIGFRNPLYKDGSEKKAIVIPLKNFTDVIDKSQKPVFGKPLLWDLNGLGIRTMEYSAFHKCFFIIAGSPDEKRHFVLYQWSANQGLQPELIRELNNLPEDFTPEALFTFENSDSFLVLSDDGSLIISVSNPSECIEGELLEGMKCPNKYLADPNAKTFRAVSLKP